MPLNPRDHPLAQLPVDEENLLERVRSLVADHIGPQAEAVTREDVFAWDTFRLLAKEGVFATAFPKAHGGSDASMLARVRIIEEVASACSTAASMVTGTDLSSRPIVAGASAALQAEWLPQLASGAKQSAFALSEPGAGSDVARLDCRYTESADGSLLITGSKNSSPGPTQRMSSSLWRGARAGLQAPRVFRPFW